MNNSQNAVTNHDSVSNKYYFQLYLFAMLNLASPGNGVFELIVSNFVDLYKSAIKFYLKVHRYLDVYSIL